MRNQFNNIQPGIAIFKLQMGLWQICFHAKTTNMKEEDKEKNKLGK